MGWKDSETLKVIAQYLRLMTGFALTVLLIYLFSVGRVDLETVVKAMLSVLIVDRIGMAVTTRPPT